MAGAHELTPVLGVGAACRAMGLWRGVSARQRTRSHRRTLMGPPQPALPRPCPPLALDAQERQTLLDTLNSERFADTAPAAVHATLLGEGTYISSVRMRAPRASLRLSHISRESRSIAPRQTVHRQLRIRAN